MKYEAKGIAQPMIFTILGAMFGVLGNLMVTSYYRLADQLGTNTFNSDIIAFLLSAVFLFIFSYWYLIKLKKQMKTEN